MPYEDLTHDNYVVEGFRSAVTEVTTTHEESPVTSQQQEGSSLDTAQSSLDQSTQQMSQVQEIPEDSSEDVEGKLHLEDQKFASVKLLDNVQVRLMLADVWEQAVYILRIHLFSAAV